MSAPRPVEQAFCTACGAPLVDGACSRACDAAPPVRSTPDPPHRDAAAATAGRRPVRRVLVAAAVVLAIALGAAAVVMVTSTQDSLDRTTARLEATQEQVEALRQQVQVSQAEQQAAADRLSALESELGDQPDIPATAKAASRSVFTIMVGDGSGSGFVLGEGGRSTTLVTNFHVVARTYVNGGRTVEVTRGDVSYTGRITDASESNDLAVITVPRRLPALEVADQRPAIGEPVLVLGSPLGLGGTVTSGIVSAFRTEDGVDYMQFSAPISPGNSGGPVVNQKGEVVGVAVAKIAGEGAEGLGFAVPTNRLCSALDAC